MPRPALNKIQSRLEILLEPDDKEAFELWCRTNQLTMSEVIRREINPFIKEGYNIH